MLITYSPSKPDPHLNVVRGWQQPSKGMPGGYAISGEGSRQVPPWAIREVDRPSRNPEKLANVGGNQSQNRVGQMSGDALTIKRKHD